MEKKGVYGDGAGIDLGIKKLAVMSDGKELQSINKTKKIRKLEKVKRRFYAGACEKRSNGCTGRFAYFPRSRPNPQSTVVG